MYIGDYIGRRALYSPDELAVVDAGKTPRRAFTYREMNDRANRLANWLRDGAGIEKGQRIAILAYDGVEYLDMFFACGKLGAIAVGLNYRLHWREVVTLVKKAKPSVVIFSDDFKETAQKISETCPSVRYFLHIEGRGIENSRNYEKVLSDSVLLPVETDNVTEEDIACLFFTGGTTGTPKGAQISHRMIAWNTLNTIIHDLRHGDLTVNTLPMFHTGGLLVYTVPLLILGGTVILTRKFEPDQVLDLIEEYAATVYAGVPTTYRMLTQADNWHEVDLSSLRFCTCGGAPLSVELIAQYQSEKGVVFKQGFGMTEFGPGVFALAEDDAERKAGSIGRPNFFVDARIVNDEGQPVPLDTVGELVLRGPSMCSGYFDDEEASETSVDEQGWFHTGDLAIESENRYFTIIDRKKDMIISGGENVYPSEVEAVLFAHPAVAQCAVVGVRDDRWGEVGKAFVVFRKGQNASLDELFAHLQHHLAGYKVPKTIEIVDSLPISGAGKVMKHELVNDQLDVGH